MKIIVGLGNPGKKYEKTRHNVGFMLLDRIVKEERTEFRKSFKAASFLARAGQGQSVLLVKPRTYMNNSGQAVSWLVRTYKVPREDILIVHDDLDLELGRIKFSRQGSSAGHRGVESIIRTLGSDTVSRLRIGISRPVEDAVDHVLSEFTAEENEIIEDIMGRMVLACNEWVDKGIDPVMQKYNSKKER